MVGAWARRSDPRASHNAHRACHLCQQQRPQESLQAKKPSWQTIAAKTSSPNFPSLLPTWKQSLPIGPCMAMLLILMLNKLLSARSSPSLAMVHIGAAEIPMKLAVQPNVSENSTQPSPGPTHFFHQSQKGRKRTRSDLPML
jgi:hypothetical protein